MVPRCIPDDSGAGYQTAAKIIQSEVEADFYVGSNKDDKKEDLMQIQPQDLIKEASDASLEFDEEEVANNDSHSNFVVNQAPQDDDVPARRRRSVARMSIDSAELVIEAPIPVESEQNNVENQEQH